MVSGLGNNALDQGTANPRLQAIPHLERALEFDPNFALALAFTATVYANNGQTGLAADFARRAFDLRDRVSERERFYIEAAYYSFVTGELEKANQVYKQWAEEYPADVAPHSNLALNYEFMGDFDKGAEQARAAMDIAPTSVSGYANLITAYLALDRIDEAKTIYDQAKQHNFDNQSLRQLPERRL